MIWATFADGSLDFDSLLTLGFFVFHWISAKHDDVCVDGTAFELLVAFGFDISSLFKGESADRGNLELIFGER